MRSVPWRVSSASAMSRGFSASSRSAKFARRYLPAGQSASLGAGLTAQADDSRQRSGAKLGGRTARSPRDRPHARPPAHFAPAKKARGHPPRSRLAGDVEEDRGGLVEAPTPDRVRAGPRSAPIRAVPPPRLGQARSRRAPPRQPPRCVPGRRRPATEGGAQASSESCGRSRPDRLRRRTVGTGTTGGRAEPGREARGRGIGAAGLDRPCRPR